MNSFRRELDVRFINRADAGGSGASSVADPELGPKIAAAIPVGRVAEPREVAGPVLFLCTPLAGFISGEVLNVNGGSVLAG